MFRFVLSLALGLSVLHKPAEVQTYPAPPDHSAALTELFDDIQAAGSEGIARLISNEMWALWLDAPDGQAQ